MARKSTEMTDLQRMRLMLQSQQMPTLQSRPIDSVGEGISQGASNIMSMVMQSRQQAALQNMLAQQQAAELAAEQQRQASFEPLQGLTGFDGATLSNLDSSVLNTLVQDGLKKSEAISKAQNLQEQFGRVQPGINDPNFLNLSPDNGYNMSGEQAALIAGNPAASQGIAEAVAAPQRVQMLQDSLNALVPDRSTMNGQKAYRNTYQELFGNAPVTDVQMQQEQAALQNALLGNQGQLINNTFAPFEKRMGLVNSQLDAQGKTIDNNWKPLLNQAGLESTEAGTLEKGLKNKEELRRQKLELKAQEIIADPTLTTQTKMALLSSYQTDPNKFVNYLDQFSKKGGVAGVKGDKLLEFIDKNNQNASPKPVKQNTPVSASAPKKAAQPAKAPVYVSGGTTKPLKPQVRTLGDALGAGLGALGRMLGPDPNAPVLQDVQRLRSQSVAPSTPAKPNTIAEAVQKKNYKQALSNYADREINTSMLIQPGYKAVEQDYLNTRQKLIDETDKRRKQEYEKVFGKGKW